MLNHIVQAVQSFCFVVILYVGQYKVEVWKNIVVNAQKMVRSIAFVVEPLNAQQRLHRQVLIVVYELTNYNVLLVTA